MKYINIECQRFSVAHRYAREDSGIEMVVEIDQFGVIRQFTAKEIVEAFDIGGLLDEIGLLICLEHFTEPNGMTIEDFKAIMERAK